MRTRSIATLLLCLVALPTLSACMGSEKGNGLSRLDTITEEDKAEDAWVKSFYGKNHCGVWEGTCKPGSDEGGGGGGGMWTGGIGPSDSGASSDSGSSN